MKGHPWRFAACVVIALAAAGAEARSLHWRALEVEATLEASGELRVRERHAMVFDGDWNGGERSFRIEPGQEIDGLTIARVDAAGREVPLRLARGSSVPLHAFTWVDGETIRWRSRNATDPPFRDRELVYVIDYTLRNVVRREGDSFVLDHDFAFGDRPGAIEAYTLRLTLDPAWAPLDGIPEEIRRTDLARGVSVVVTTRLAWRGEGAPRFVASGKAKARSPRAALPAPIDSGSKLAAAGSFAGFAVAAILWFFARERATGRYDRRPAITRAWLEENLLVHRPEVVGAAWDRSAGQGEVAALIAVMTAEGKIDSATGTRLRLLVPRDSLSEYERAFIDRLFVSGDEIDVPTLRRHYATTGFDPTAAIRNPLRRAAAQLIGTQNAAPYAAGCVVAVLGIPLLAVAISLDRSLEPMALLGIPILLANLGLAAVYRTEEIRGRAFAALVPAPVLAYAAWGITAAERLGPLVALLVFAAIALLVVLAGARWQGTRDQFRMLADFRRARRFLARQLRKGDFELEDRLVPYLLAFDLGSELDRWLVAAPRAPAGASRGFEGGGARVTTSLASPAASFAAGGGAFGGAGASGSWSRSIGSFAASIPSPRSGGSGSSSRSSSGSRSRSSGGGSSGGGRGGGW